MPRSFVIDANKREALDMELTPYGRDQIEGPGYIQATITDAGDRLVWSVRSSSEAWLLVEGHRAPIQGNAMILGPEGADPTIDREWIAENVDFGRVQELGTDRMFMGERNRRLITT